QAGLVHLDDRRAPDRDPCPVAGCPGRREGATADPLEDRPALRAPDARDLLSPVGKYLARLTGDTAEVSGRGCLRVREGRVGGEEALPVAATRDVQRAFDLPGPGVPVHQAGRVRRAGLRRQDGGDYWTVAVSELAAFRVKVQLRVLAPALLHTPDQITDRPWVALRVMLVPTGKLAEPVVPTGTLTPAGVEMTFTPARPVAVTVSVAVAGAVPQTFTTPAPPQVCGAVQTPQVSVPPQPSEIVPQFFPCAAQVVG